jgi:thiamine-phosphate pyrophosphorylase
MAEAALAAAPPETIALQLREKDLEARELAELARALLVICDRHHARLLVNDRLDVAIASRADGVHLPANSFAIADARGLIGHDRLVGVSTHEPEELIAASRAGADFVVYGPVFDPISKGAHTAARGANGLIAACSAASIPVFGLGGMTAARVRELRTTAKAEKASVHPARIAVVGAIFGSPDPAAAMRDLIDALTL